MYSQPQQPKKKVNTKMLIIIAVIVAVVIAGIIFVPKLLSNKNEENIAATKKNNSSISGSADKNTSTIYDENVAFLLRIDDVFTNICRGIVVTGKGERGTIKMNDEVQIIGIEQEIIITIVTGI